jgi:hypothetical protein
VQLSDGVFRQGTQFGSEGNIAAFLADGVVNGPFGHGATKHFFEAKSLGAKLNVIVIPAAGLAALVFDV